MKKFFSVFVVLAIALIAFSSCSKKKESSSSTEKKEIKKKESKKIDYVSDEVSFVVAFDSEGKKRTVKLKRGQDHLDIYIIINFPETMQISATEFRLSMPEGIEVESDEFYKKRTAVLGRFEHGIAETFPCVPGPKLILHRLTLKVGEPVKNGEISLLPSLKTDFIGVASCEGGFPKVRASSYKAIINPSE